MKQKRIKPRVPRYRCKDETLPGSRKSWTWQNYASPPYWYGPHGQQTYDEKLGKFKEVWDEHGQWPPPRGSYTMGNFTRKSLERKSPPMILTGERVTLDGGTLYGPIRIEGNLMLDVDFGLEMEVPSWVKGDQSQIAAQVVNRAYANAYGSKAQVLVTAAEMGKSISMVKRPFAGARKLLGQMTKRYTNLLARGVAAGQAAANAWLEYRMGWKPLLFDLENIAKATHASLSEIDVQYDKTYRSSFLQEWNGGGSGLSTKDWEESTVRWEREYSKKFACGVIVRENLYDEKSKRPTAMFGMELHDVAPAIWELVPYSFVVDRFIDVGTWLQAIQPRPNTKLMAAWLTTVEKDRLHIQANLEWKYGSGKFIPLSGNQGTKEVISNVVKRENGPTPSILPALNSRDLVVQQHIDHAALLLQQLVGLFPEVKARNFGMPKRVAKIKR